MHFALIRSNHSLSPQSRLARHLRPEADTGSIWRTHSPHNRVAQETHDDIRDLGFKHDLLPEGDNSSGYSLV